MARSKRPKPLNRKITVESPKKDTMEESYDPPEIIVMPDKMRPEDKPNPESGKPDDKPKPVTNPKPVNTEPDSKK
jgi:hypothetical protein